MTMALNDEGAESQARDFCGIWREFWFWRETTHVPGAYFAKKHETQDGVALGAGQAVES